MRFDQIILRNLRRRPLRSGLTCAGIAMASAAFVALVGATHGFEQSFLDLYRERGADLVVQRGGGAMQLSNGIDQALGEKIAAIPDVQQVIGGLMDLVALEDFNLFAVIVNGWAPDCPVLDRVKIVAGRRLQAGDRRRVMLGETLAKSIGLSVGNMLDVYGKSFEVVGVFQSFSVYESGGMFLLLEEMQQMIDRPGQVTGYVVKLRTEGTSETVAALKREIESLDATLAATPTADFVANITQIRVTRAAAWVISTMALVIGAIGVLNTMVTSVFERAREIGLLRAIGWRKQRVVALILGESLGMSLVGAIVGTILGTLLLRGIATLPACAGLIEGNLSPDVVFKVLLMATTTGVLGAVYPAWWAARMCPTESLRHT